MNEIETFRLIGAISRQATTDVNQEVSRYSLSNNLFLYLMRIVENEGITQTELVKLAHVDKTTLSRALTKLASLGYLQKKADPKNNNFKQLFPTEKALAIYNQLFNLEQAYVNKALGKLTPVELLSLNKTLAKINSQLIK